MQDFSASIERTEPAAPLRRDPRGQVLEQHFVVDELLASGATGAMQSPDIEICITYCQPAGGRSDRPASYLHALRTARCSAVEAARR